MKDDLFACKQMLVIRKDLNMPVGKIGSQVAHASSAIILNNIFKFTFFKLLYWFGVRRHKSAAFNWANGKFTKIVVYVESEAELDAVLAKAVEKGLMTSLIVDEGRTVFNNMPTKTVIGIGPAWRRDLVGVTDKLKLL